MKPTIGSIEGLCPTTVLVENFAPYFTADEFAANINAHARTGRPWGIMANIEGHRIYGLCVSARNINTLPFIKPLAQGLPMEGVLIRFQPQRTGKYFITYGAANGNEPKEIRSYHKEES